MVMIIIVIMTIVVMVMMVMMVEIRMRRRTMLIRNVGDVMVCCRKSHALSLVIETLIM